jgi:hypothetical protein
MQMQMLEKTKKTNKLIEHFFLEIEISPFQQKSGQELRLNFDICSREFKSKLPKQFQFEVKSRFNDLLKNLKLKI